MLDRTVNEFNYLDLLERAASSGVARHDRTGVGTYSVFGPQISLDLEHGFPLLTTKQVNWQACWAELRWMLAGDTNVNRLAAKIWDAWADEDGDLGPVYGRQWRAWTGVSDTDTDDDVVTVDQLADAEHRLRTDPDSRRIVVSAWNVAQLDKMRLPPCHVLFQFWTYVRPVQGGAERVLCTHVYQRSADLFIGVPFNMASYAALTHLVAARVGMRAGQLVFSFGDAHVYANHADAVQKQLGREPRPAPSLWVDADAVRALPDWRSLQKRDNVYVLGLRGYDPWPAIRAEVAV